jgi:hypothetical protein
VLIVTMPRVALAPSRSDYAEQAIRDGGGEPVDPDARADALIWLDAADMNGLREAEMRRPYQTSASACEMHPCPPAREARVFSSSW